MNLPAWLNTDARFWGASVPAQWAFAQIAQLEEIPIDPTRDAVAALASIVRGFGDRPREVLEPVLDELVTRGLVVCGEERLIIVALDPGIVVGDVFTAPVRNRKAKFYLANRDSENDKRAERRRRQRDRSTVPSASAGLTVSVPDRAPKSGECPPGPSRTNVPDSVPDIVPDTPPRPRAPAVSESAPNTPEKTTETKLHPSVPLENTRASATLSAPDSPVQTSRTNVPDIVPDRRRVPDLAAVTTAIRSRCTREQLDPSLFGPPETAFMALLARERWTLADIETLADCAAADGLRPRYQGALALQAMMNPRDPTSGAYAGSGVLAAMNIAQVWRPKVTPPPPARKPRSTQAPNTQAATAVLKNFLNTPRSEGGLK